MLLIKGFCMFMFVQNEDGGSDLRQAVYTQQQQPQPPYHTRSLVGGSEASYSTVNGRVWLDDPGNESMRGTNQGM